MVKKVGRDIRLERLKMRRRTVPIEEGDISVEVSRGKARAKWVGPQNVSWERARRRPVRRRTTTRQGRRTTRRRTQRPRA